MNDYEERREPWQIAAARFFVDNSEKGFTGAQYKEFIKSNYDVNERHLDFFFDETVKLPTGRQYDRNAVDGTWIPPLELVSTITDYDELVEARKNAKSAFWLSLTAIIISAITLLVTLN